MGATGHADGGWFSNQVTSNNYFLGTHPNQTDPYIFVAVIDSVGTFIYRIPSSESDKIWSGLSRKSAACTLDARPTQRPPNNGPPCDDSNPYCALFLPNCQAESWGGNSAGHQGGANQGCKVNSQQGWCVGTQTRTRSNRKYTTKSPHTRNGRQSSMCHNCSINIH